MKQRLVALSVAVLAAGLARAAQAAEASAGDPALFALILGVNQNASPSQVPLRYADDDAARYRDFFRTVGARTYLLATLDENTRRLHPQAAAEAMPARDGELTAAVTRLVADVEAAHRSGRATTLYVVYAGHGDVEGETGYVNLEDGRLTGPALAERVLDRVRADRTHVIVDACSSYYFALGRGSGGQRRALHGFTQLGGALVEQRDVGLLLSTSSARESHEWSAFQAGVFSHEVRSGMFGAADADGDGVVSYAEMAAFIKRANQAIPNEKYRPEVFWRPPRGSTALVDLRAALERRVEIAPADSGHYFLEDSRGVRLADLHNGSRGTVRMLRPGADLPRLYLQRTGDGREFVLPAGEAVVSTATLAAQEARVGTRSAAHEAFSTIFALPFDQASVDELVSRPDGLITGSPDPYARGVRPTTILGVSLIGLSAVATGGAVWASLSAHSLRNEIGPATPQAVAARGNDRIRARNRVTVAAAGIAAVAAVTGTLLWLWPDAALSAAVSPTGATVVLRSPF